MTDKNARSRIEALFISYQSLLRRNGLQWLTKKNERVAVMHFLSTIRPLSLQSRLQSDLSLSYHRLETDFKGFMAHAIKLSDAFQLVDNGPPDRDKRGNGNCKRNIRNHDSLEAPSDRESKGNESSSSSKKAPICL